MHTQKKMIIAFVVAAIVALILLLLALIMVLLKDQLGKYLIAWIIVLTTTICRVN